LIYPDLLLGLNMSVKTTLEYALFAAIAITGIILWSKGDDKVAKNSAASPQIAQTIPKIDVQNSPIAPPKNDNTKAANISVQSTPVQSQPSVQIQAAKENNPQVPQMEKIIDVKSAYGLKPPENHDANSPQMQTYVSSLKEIHSYQTLKRNEYILPNQPEGENIIINAEVNGQK
jgi:hypothetical protein